jgi:hypothetical protein
MAGVGASGSLAGDVDEDDGKVALAEGAGEFGGVGEDFGDRMGCGHADDAFLEIDDDECGSGVELGEGHAGCWMLVGEDASQKCGFVHKS